MPSPIGTIATDEDLGAVVTEDDLLNTSHPLEGQEAPELIGIQSWIDSEPIALSDFRGKVVLLDFWTYSCINCIRTLPSIVEWQDKYGYLGLQAIGIHTPEIEFEKDADNVRLAIERYEIDYPVAQDNDYETWKAFGVQAWPAKYLIDADGIIQHAEAGEGGYVAVEQSIRYWLNEAAYDVSSVPFEPENYRLDPEIDRAANVADNEGTRTREIHAGSTRKTCRSTGSRRPGRGFSTTTTTRTSTPTYFSTTSRSTRISTSTCRAAGTLVPKASPTPGRPRGLPRHQVQR